ncbi:MAG: DUF362 domain-containing protein [Candidatus Nanoarchaeia archaeon]
MAGVYFSKSIEKIINKIDFASLGNNVAIKVHFGERGCVTYINPEIVKDVYSRIVAKGKKATLVECNVLYKGSRTNSTDHIRTAKEHGFDFAPIDILDGENGQEFVDVDGCKIGAGIEKYDSMVVISHFKGHMMAGFGGALKNLGMGFGSRAGKLAMHSNVRPSISGKCIGCGVCLKNCNAKAIKLINGKAKISNELCEGCAMCIAVCPRNAVSIPWASGTTEELQERIVKYSLAVLKKIPNAIFINVLENITQDCDCMGTKQKNEIEDIGIIMGRDPVSIEKASLDLANKAGFSKVQKEINKDKQIEFAVELGMGDISYQLINLDEVI